MASSSGDGIPSLFIVCYVVFFILICGFFALSSCPISVQKQFRIGDRVEVIDSYSEYRGCTGYVKKYRITHVVLTEIICQDRRIFDENIDDFLETSLVLLHK